MGLKEIVLSAVIGGFVGTLGGGLAAFGIAEAASAYGGMQTVQDKYGFTSNKAGLRNYDYGGDFLLDYGKPITLGGTAAGVLVGGYMATRRRRW
jgi:hypothetical protein